MSRYLVVFFVTLFSFISSSAQNGSSLEPDTVRLGTYVMSLHDINFRDKEYTLRFWIWMKYKNPDFDFANSVEVPNAKDLEILESIVSRDTATGEVWVLMKLKCVMKQSWKVADYPFDKQFLSIQVENSKYDTRSLVFKADTTGQHFDPDFTIDGWRINKIAISTNQHDYLTDFGDVSLDSKVSHYAAFNINIDIDRSALGLFLKLFVGMYIAFSISCIAFLVDAEHAEPKFSLPVGGLFAAVGNKYIIDSLLPESSTFTLVDALHTTTFIFIFIILLISSISLLLYGKNNLKRSLKFDRYGSIITIVVYFIINLILIANAALH